MIYKKSWKYILKYSHDFYYRPMALKDFSDVAKGDLGGFVTSYHNLSQKGNCWIYNCASIIRNAHVSEDAQIRDRVVVSGCARIFGNAKISENAKIYRNAEISGNSRVCGDARVKDYANISGCVIISGNAKIKNQTLIKGVYSE